MVKLWGNYGGHFRKTLGKGLGKLLFVAFIKPIINRLVISCLFNGDPIVGPLRWYPLSAPVVVPREGQKPPAHHVEFTYAGFCKPVFFENNWGHHDRCCF